MCQIVSPRLCTQEWQSRPGCVLMRPNVQSQVPGRVPVLDLFALGEGAAAAAPYHRGESGLNDLNKWDAVESVPTGTNRAL